MILFTFKKTFMFKAFLTLLKQQFTSLHRYPPHCEAWCVHIFVFLLIFVCSKFSSFNCFHFSQAVTYILWLVVDTWSTLARFSLAFFCSFMKRVAFFKGSWGSFRVGSEWPSHRSFDIWPFQIILTLHHVCMYVQSGLLKDRLNTGLFKGS
jgi:hypothetical protein